MAVGGGVVRPYARRAPSIDGAAAATIPQPLTWTLLCLSDSTFKGLHHRLLIREEDHGREEAFSANDCPGATLHSQARGYRCVTLGRWSSKSRHINVIYVGREIVVPSLVRWVRFDEQPTERDGMEDDRGVWAVAWCGSLPGPWVAGAVRDRRERPADGWRRGNRSSYL